MASSKIKPRQLLISTSGGITVGSNGGIDILVPGKGYLLTGDGAGAVTVIAPGTDGQYLQADSTQLNGLTYADPQGGFRNRIFNGAMRIAQRGTSVAGAVGPVGGVGTYTLDRWQWFNSSAGAVTVTRDTDVPSTLNVPYSLKVAVTTADASVAAGDFAYIGQPIEGYTFLPLKGQTFVLSFWMKSNTTGTYSVSFLNSAKDRSYVGIYVVSAANTWAKYTVRLTHSTTGTWDYTNGAGLRVSFALMAGTTFQGSSGSWAASGALATSSQPNILASTSNNFFLTGVQLELGTIPTPFENRPDGVELTLCQRYFWSSYDDAVTPGTVSTSGEQRYIAAGTGGEASAFVTFPAIMRIQPSVTSFYSPSTGAINNRRHYNAGADEAVTFFNVLGARGGSGSNTGHTTGDIYGFQMTCNAELA